MPYPMAAVRGRMSLPSGIYLFWDEFMDDRARGAVNGTLATDAIHTRSVANDLLTTNLWDSGSGFESTAYFSMSNGDGLASRVSDTKYAGTYSFKLLAGASANTYARTGTSYALESLVPGNTYRLKFWTRGDGTNAGRFRVLDQTNGNAVIVATTSTGVTSTTWTQVTQDFVAPAGCYSAHFEAMCPTANGGAAWFDEGEVKPVYSHTFTASGELEIGRNPLGANPAAVTWDYTPDFLRGRVVIFDITSKKSANAEAVVVGLNSNYLERAFMENGIITCGDSTSYQYISGNFVAGTNYKLALVLDGLLSHWLIKGGAYTHWTIIRLEHRREYAYDRNRLIIYTDNGGYASSSFVRVHETTWLPAPVVADQFSAGANTDRMGHSWHRNICYNGGFEILDGAGFNGWTQSAPGNGAIVQEVTERHSGTYSLKITRTSAGGGTSTVYYPFPYRLPGENYTVRFWTRGDGTAQGRLEVKASLDVILSARDTGVTGTDWTQVSYSFTVPAGQQLGQTSLYLYQPTANGAAYYDDVEIYRTDAGPNDDDSGAQAWGGGAYWSTANGLAVNNPPLSAELLANPGLEGAYTSGVAANWAKFSTPTVAESADAHGGSKAQSVVGDNVYGKGVDASVGTVANKLFQVSSWTKKAAGTSSLISRFGVGGRRNYITNTATYVQNTHNAIVRNGITEGARFLGYSTSNTYLIDDASVKEIAMADCIRVVTGPVNPHVTAVIYSSDRLRGGYGIILNLDSASNPQNYVLVYALQEYIFIDKCVAGAITNVADSGGAIWTASPGVMTVRKFGNAYRCTGIGTDQTISDAGIVSNTLHGIFAMDNQAQFQRFAVWDSGHLGAYDAALDRWAGVNP